MGGEGSRQIQIDWQIGWIDGLANHQIVSMFIISIQVLIQIAISLHYIQSTFNKPSCQFPHLSSHFLFGHLLLKMHILKHHVTPQPFPPPSIRYLPTQFPNLSPSGVPSMGTRALMGTDSGCSGSVAKVWRSPMPPFYQEGKVSGDHLNLLVSGGYLVSWLMIKKWLYKYVKY